MMTLNWHDIMTRSDSERHEMTKNDFEMTGNDLDWYEMS